MEGFLVIIAFIVFGFLIQFLYGGIERAFKPWYLQKKNNPNAPDDMIETNMKILRGIKTHTYDKAKKSIQEATKKTYSTSDKLKLLKELEELKNKNVISWDDYDLLRKDIMK
ncbi:MAG: hypothetical protein EOP56_19365 [Sphingobacteriales bacterium]|nr:MAG: hypothetical protein EOP56_19365 [Sphingobacteriales bacterium]